MKSAPEVTLKAESEGMVSANWTDEAARYHVWIERWTDGWKIGETIYKNPPLAADGKCARTDAPGYFDTRRLDLLAKAHAAVAATIAELATPATLDTLTARYVSDRDKQARDEARARRVAHLAQCVAAIQNATADELAAAMLNATVATAAAAERLRAAATSTPPADEENPFHPESPEGRAWDDGRMNPDGSLKE